MGKHYITATDVSPSLSYHTWAHILTSSVLMAWPSRSSPFFHPGHVQLHQRRLGETFARRLATLAHKLAVNGLLPDEATDRQGNCGLDAFAKSLLAQMTDGRVGAGQRECQAQATFEYNS